MRSVSSSILVFLLVLHVLVCGTYGSRLGKFGRKSNEVQVFCKDEDHCASKGNNRKLTTPTTSSTSMAKSIRQNHKENGVNKVELTKEDQNASSSSASKSNGELDLIDMTEMDYSPATKKSPIHN